MVAYLEQNYILYLCKSLLRKLRIKGGTLEKMNHAVFCIRGSKRITELITEFIMKGKDVIYSHLSIYKFVLDIYTTDGDLLNSALLF